MESGVPTKSRLVAGCSLLRFRGLGYGALRAISKRRQVARTPRLLSRCCSSCTRGVCLTLFPLSLRKAHMNANISLILATAVSISTIIYTFYSIQLWRTTRAAAEISRQAALSNLWAELNRYLEILRQQNAPEVVFLEKLSNVFLEFMISNLIANAAKRNDRSVAEFRRKISELVAENEAHASKLTWVSKFAEWR